MHKLRAQPHDPTQPDLFGQIHTVLFDAAFEAILDGNHPVANVLFGALFQQMGPTAARLSTDLTGQNLTAQILYGQEPIMAMMELSGYAIFMNELDRGDTWSGARPLWDGLQALRDPDLPRNLAEIAAQDDSIYALSGIALARQARRQRLTNLLHDHGIASSASSFDPFGPPQPLHPSPLIAAFLEHGISTPWDFTDLFLVHGTSRRSSTTHQSCRRVLSPWPLGSPTALVPMQVTPMKGPIKPTLHRRKRTSIVTVSMRDPYRDLHSNRSSYPYALDTAEPLLLKHLRRHRRQPSGFYGYMFVEDAKSVALGTRIR